MLRPQAMGRVAIVCATALGLVSFPASARVSGTLAASLADVVEEWSEAGSAPAIVLVSGAEADDLARLLGRELGRKTPVHVIVPGVEDPKAVATRVAAEKGAGCAALFANQGGGRWSTHRVGACGPPQPPVAAPAAPAASPSG